MHFFAPPLAEIPNFQTPSPQCVCHLATGTLHLDHTLQNNTPVYVDVRGRDRQKMAFVSVRACAHTHTDTHAHMGQRAHGKKPNTAHTRQRLTDGATAGKMRRAAIKQALFQ